MNYKQLAIFSKEFKKKLKKYRTLEQDLDNFKKSITEVDLLANRNFAVLYQNEKLMIVKARFFCKSLRGKTLRVIYVYYKSEHLIEFIEIYSKGDKVAEDKERIKEYLRN